MKIAYLITKSNYGGAQKYTFDLATAAEKKGHSVLVACGGTGEDNASTGLLVEKLEASHIEVRVIHNFLRDVSITKDVRSFFEILSLLHKERPDVLHISSSKAGAIGVLAGRFVGIKRIVFTIHGLPADESWRPRWQRLLIAGVTWLTIYLTHATITISKEDFERLSNQSGIKQKIKRIRNGVEPISFLSADLAKSQLVPQIQPNTILIGGVGELHPNKNWSLLIHALTTLPKNVHICIIGEGEERGQLELLAEKLQVSERVHLVGYQENVATLLSAFTMLVLPSKKEGLPYVILEAGTASLPVITSDLPGTREIIETGMNGILIEQTPNMLSASIQILLRDEGMQRRLGFELNKTVLNGFSQTAMVENTLEVYSSIIPSDTGRADA